MEPKQETIAEAVEAKESTLRGLGAEYRIKQELVSAWLVCSAAQERLESEYQALNRLTTSTVEVDRSLSQAIRNMSEAIGRLDQVLQGLINESMKEWWERRPTQFVVVAQYWESGVNTVYAFAADPGSDWVKTQEKTVKRINETPSKCKAKSRLELVSINPNTESGLRQCIALKAFWR